MFSRFENSSKTSKIFILTKSWSFMNNNIAFTTAVSCVESFFVDLVENNTVSPKKIGELIYIDYESSQTYKVFKAAFENLTLKYQTEAEFEFFKVCKLNNILPTEMAIEIALAGINFKSVRQKRFESELTRLMNTMERAADHIKHGKNKPPMSSFYFSKITSLDFQAI
jgi:hypothetical protein